MCLGQGLETSLEFFRFKPLRQSDMLDRVMEHDVGLYDLLQYLRDHDIVRDEEGRPLWVSFWMHVMRRCGGIKDYRI